MNLSPEDIGKRILGRIKELNKTQTQICNEAGLTKTAMSNYVNGNRVPDTSTILILSKILNTSVEWLLTGDDTSISATIQSTSTVEAEAEKMSADERLLLENYRDMDDQQKREMVNKSAVLLATDQNKRYTTSQNTEKDSDKKYKPSVG